MTILEETARILEMQGTHLRTRCFRRWDDALLKDFSRIDRKSFGRELVYTEGELAERERKAGFEGLFLYDGNRPEAVLLVYADALPGMVFIDTLAVMVPGRGTGTSILEALIESARKQGLAGLALDTEWINDKGQHLVEYYRKFGFREDQRVSGNGNIHLQLRFPDSMPGDPA